MTMNDPHLPPGTHYKRLGESEWHTVPELRTNISQEDDMNDSHDTPVPNSYAPDLARLRAAAGLSEYDRARAEQFARIEAEAAAITAQNDEAFRALADAPKDLDHQYAPPEPWTEGLKALRAKERSR